MSVAPAPRVEIVVFGIRGEKTEEEKAGFSTLSLMAAPYAERRGVDAPAGDDPVRPWIHVSVAKLLGLEVCPDLPEVADGERPMTVPTDAHWRMLRRLIEECRPKGKTQSHDMRHTIEIMAFLTAPASALIPRRPGRPKRG